MYFSSAAAAPAALFTGLSLLLPSAMGSALLVPEHDVELCAPTSLTPQQGRYWYNSMDHECWDRPNSECEAACVTFIPHIGTSNPCRDNAANLHNASPAIGIVIGEQVTKDGWLETSRHGDWFASFVIGTSAIPWRDIEEIWFRAVAQFANSADSFVPQYIEFKMRGDYGTERMLVSCST